MPYRSPEQRAAPPQGRGRYPDFDVLDNVDAWDDVTAGVVLGRLARPGELSFFTPAEEAIARPLLDLLLAQDDEPRVPVLALIDDARVAHSGRTFAELVTDEQAALIQAVQDRVRDQEPWHGWPAEHVWSLWTRYACTAFYSHPWAWNEIGFPGPAYPRGYVNPGINSRERWE